MLVSVFVCLSISQAATKMVQSTQDIDGLKDTVTQDSSLSETAKSTEDRK